MRILRIVASVDPKHGGPVENIHHSAFAMSQWGHKTDVVTLDLPSAPYLATTPLQVHPLGDQNLLSRVRYSPKLVPWLRYNVSNYDVAVIHGLWNYSSIGAWWALAGRNLPYVAFTHGSLEPWFKQAYPLKHALKQMYWAAAEGRVLRDAAFVLFTSEEERQLARKEFRGFEYQDKVVSYGTADPDGNARSQISAFRAHLPTLKERPYFLFLSRIHPKKACDLLIRAFACVANDNTEIDLVIAGPDQVGWTVALKELARTLGIADRIHWPGMLSGNIKWGAFRGAQAFVLPSHSENFGIVVAEALACGTPVLISDKVNIWREVDQGCAGLIAPDTEAGARALFKQFLAITPLKRQDMGSAARACFLEHFEINNAAAHLTSVLEEAVAKGGRNPPIAV